jgi:ATP-binding cassette, subfamily B (MDR/TAP), member 1
MSLLFGNLTKAFTDFGTALDAYSKDNSPANYETVLAARATFKSTAATNAAAFCYIGLGMFVVTYVYMNVWVYTAEVNAKRIREAYLRAVLRQDIAFFDNVGSGEVATRIQTDTRE